MQEILRVQFPPSICTFTSYTVKAIILLAKGVIIMRKLIDRIGNVAIANNGMKMRIIAYRGCHDIDIQFEDGTVIHNKYRRHFLYGKIANPNLKRGGTFCGYKIIKRLGRVEDSVYYYCVDKDGNEHMFTPQLMMEKAGVSKVF